MGKLRVFESFSGIGSMSMALRNLGIDFELVGTSEVDRYAILAYDAIHGNNEDIVIPSKEEMLQEFADKNIAYNFSSGKSEIPRGIKDITKLYKAHIRSKNFGDIQKINPEDLPEMDLYTYSFPCFIAGTKVLTNKGFINIEDISVGDLVMTHNNRFRMVLDTMNCQANEVYRLRTMCSDDIITTEEHPFYVREKYRIWNNEKRMYDRKFKEPQWVKAKNLNKDYYVGIAINQESKLPNWEGVEFEWSDGRKNRKSNILKEKFSMNEFWWIIGRYMGDGWLRHGSGIIICCAKDEVNEIKPYLEKLEFNYNLIEERAVYKFHIPFKEIGKYVEQFGKGALNKRLTNDIFDLPIHLLKSFLEGYFSADGHIEKNLQKATSISRELLYGIGQCVAKVYNRPFSIYKFERPKKAIIEDREINQHDTYILSFKEEVCKQDKAFYEDGYIWCPIRDINKEEFNGTVYNIEVEEDNSYVVQNIIVHNCKNISVAGQMAGLEKGSGTQSSLVWESIRIIEYHKPKYLLMENVKNLVSDKFMPYFKMICEELEKLGYNNYWSVLNGRDFNVPQNRERVMMLSIRKDVDKGVFGMPIGVPTTKRLKDVLDDEVEDRYYIPKPIMDKFIPNDNFKTLYNNDGQSPTQVGFIQKGEDGVQHQSNTVYDGNCVSCTLCAGDWKSPKMFMVEGKPIRLGGCFDEPNGSTHQAGSVWEKEGLSPTIDTMQGGYRQPLVFVNEPRIITERICQQVKVRKYEVDVEKLKVTLKQAKNNVGLTINQITEKLGVTKTTVEHWFRSDDCFSIPSEDIWFSLKELLNIETDEFDKSIMEWEIKDNEYDISNRVYNAEGICPTLTTAGESGTKKIKIEQQIMIDKSIKPSVRQNFERDIDKIANTEEGKIFNCECESGWQDNKVGVGISPTIRALNPHTCVYSDYKIRKLTPKECWRLMGFTDEDFFKAKDLGGLSNTKLYERAGRGIVVPMLEEIFRNMMKNEEE